MQKHCLFFSGAGPPHGPFRLPENAGFLDTCRRAASAVYSHIFPPSRCVSAPDSHFRSSGVPVFAFFILLTSLLVFLFWSKCLPASFQPTTRCPASFFASFFGEQLCVTPAPSILTRLPASLDLGLCAVSHPSTSPVIPPTQQAYSTGGDFLNLLLPQKDNERFSSSTAGKHIPSSPSSSPAPEGLHQRRPCSVSSYVSAAALVPLSLSVLPSPASWLAAASLPALLHVHALPDSSAAAAGTGLPAPLTPAPAGGPIQTPPTAGELASEAAGLWREGRSGSRVVSKSSVLAAERRRLAAQGSGPGFAAEPHSSSIFSLHSFLPVFTASHAPSPPSNGDKGGAAAEGDVKGSRPSPSSSAPTSLSSAPHSSGTAGEEGTGDGRSEQRETARSAAAADETGPAGSNGAEGGGGGGRTKEEGLEASLTNVNMLLLALCLLCCFTLGYFIHVNMIPHLPDSAAAMLTGVVFGLLARLWGVSPSENSFLHFDPEFFYFVLLPPIVLEAGFCLNKAAFLYNLGPILLLSILGTLLTTVIIAKVTLRTAHTCGLEGPPHELRGFSWVFASLISATDTVATLSIIGSPKFRLDERGVDLYSILMGESVLNDAVSIALTRSCLRLFFTAEAEAAQRASGADVITDFLAVVVGSLVLGIGIGGLCCFCFRHSKLKKLPEYEVAITMLTAYMAFGVSECLGFSGVVSLFFCGVMLGHFNVHNMSAKSRNSIDTVFKTIALLSEKTVFAYLGVVAAAGVGQRSFNLFFVLIALSACAVSRAACVFPMSFISNRFRRKDERIDWRQQVLIWLAGLRGAVAFALAMTIPCSFDFWRAVCRHNKELVVTTTLVLVAITTLGVGSILEYTAVKLGVVQPRRRSLSLQGYGGAAGPSSSSSAALLLLEHRQQEEALPEEESNGEGSDFMDADRARAAVIGAKGRERDAEEEERDEEEGMRGTGAPRRLLARPPPAGLLSEQERTAAAELLQAHATTRSEAGQEMVAASALLRGPSPTASELQQQQSQPPAEAGPAHTASACLRRDETADAQVDLARRDAFQRHHPRSGRFSRYESPRQQPFNTVLRFLYRLDRDFLQSIMLLLFSLGTAFHASIWLPRIVLFLLWLPLPSGTASATWVVTWWYGRAAASVAGEFTTAAAVVLLLALVRLLTQPWLGSSTSPSSSVVAADAPYAPESRPDSSGSVSAGTVSPCYYRTDKAAAAPSDRTSTTMASPQFHRQAQQ